jgi:HK97 family phage major capsid protein
MAYSDAVLRPGTTALIPEDTVIPILKIISDKSSVLSLATRLRDMRTNEQTLRVEESLPVAYTVGTNKDNSDTARINLSTMTWKNQTLIAGKFGVIVRIPNDLLEDARADGYDLFGEMQEPIAAAFVKHIDNLILNKAAGTAPTDWPLGLIPQCIAAGKTVSLATVEGGGGDIYEAIMKTGGTLEQIEDAGFEITGHVANMSIRAKMRSATDAGGAPNGFWVKDPAARTKYAIDGEAVMFPKTGALDRSTTLDLMGQWDQMVYSMRKDMTFKVLDQASIHDESDNLVANLAQDDGIALRVIMRMGWQLPAPISGYTGDEPFPFSALLV